VRCRVPEHELVREVVRDAPDTITAELLVKRRFQDHSHAGPMECHLARHNTFAKMQLIDRRAAVARKIAHYFPIERMLKTARTDGSAGDALPACRLDSSEVIHCVSHTIRITHNPNPG